DERAPAGRGLFREELEDSRHALHSLGGERELEQRWFRPLVEKGHQPQGDDPVRSGQSGDRDDGDGPRRSRTQPEADRRRPTPYGKSEHDQRAVNELEASRVKGGGHGLGAILVTGPTFWPHRCAGANEGPTRARAQTLPSRSASIPVATEALPRATEVLQT